MATKVVETDRGGSVLAQPVLALGTRAAHLERLRAGELDLLVVGGGITGSGIALDAAARGLKVGLIDKGDFAGGTSSRSTKLVHGGLRYLAQYEFALTHEALTERYILASLAPSLVEWLPFVLPVYNNPIMLARMFAGLWLYDLLAGMRTPTLHRQLTKGALLKLAPSLNPQGLLGGYIYSDCRTDDVRVTLEVLRTAVDRQAAIANHVAAVGFLKTPEGKIAGVAARDTIASESFEIRAKKVVVAGGVWIDRLLQLDDPTAPSKVRPAKGVHLVVPRDRLPLDEAYFLDTAPDGRLVFVIPWEGASLIGTTDTDYDGSLEAPFATAADVDYLLASANKAFPDARLTRDDLLSVQAGLRPLIKAGAPGGKAADQISREDKIFEQSSGLIAIAGGKLTTYRKMAQRTVDLVLRRLIEAGAPVKSVVCPTDRIGLGAFAPRPAAPKLAGTAYPELTDELEVYLRRTYGANAAAVVAIASERPELWQRIEPDTPSILAEVVFAARYDLAASIGDVLIRRTHVVQVSRGQGRAVAGVVAGLLAGELCWSPARVEAELASFTEELRQFSPREI